MYSKSTMKKISYIAVFGFILMVSSCHKQVITPNGDPIVVPSYEKAGDVPSADDTANGSSDDGSVITDPNNDNHNRRKKIIK